MKLNESAQEMTQQPSGNKSATILTHFIDLWNLLKPGMKGHGREMVASYLISFIGIGSCFASPWFLAAILDKALPARNMSLFYKYAAALLFFLSLDAVVSMVKNYYRAISSEKMFLSLRTRIVSALLRKPAKFFSRYETGDLITRISNDTEYLSLLLFDYVYAVVNCLVLIIAFTAFMITWEWRLGIYTLLLMPCYVLFLSIVQKPLSRAAKAAREKLSSQNDAMHDIFSGVKEIRFYQQYQSADRRFSDISGQFTSANIRSMLIGEWSCKALDFISQVITFVPFLLGGYWICSGINSITVGILIAYNLYLTYIAKCLESIVIGITKLAQAAPLIERLKELLDYPEEPCQQTDDIADFMDSTHIEFRNVSFSYDPAHSLLNDFSLVINPGEKVALMGPSGSGKSTLIELLTRQFKPDRGEILFGQQSINAYSLPVYLQNFSYVRQKSYIFKTSVRENIAAGWYHTPMDVIIDVAKRVRIHEAILRLPYGYDTVLGEHGVDMSGGQLQRLALARALVREPAVLLLDEFTSALDHTTEEQILQDLFLNFQNQTILCVTHSQAVARHFERVISIEKA